MEQYEEALLARYDSYWAAVKSGEGPATEYQGRKLGELMRKHNLDMGDLERLVAERKENEE